VSSKTPARVSVQSDEATEDSPVLVVVRHQRGVLSWQLPYATDRYLKASKFILAFDINELIGVI